MERIIQFLKEADTYYLATVEGDQPRVRPFGTAHIFEGKLYIQTGKVKDVGSLTVVSIFSLTKSLKTLIISMFLSFFVVKFVKFKVGICRIVWYNSCRR